jgi:hypothetical protein
MLNQLIEYMKLHEISLLQDAEKLQDIMDSFEGDYDSDEYRDLEIDDMHNTGELIATRHLLSVATDIMQSYTKEAM